jgi:Rrf2 family protein
MKVSTKGRYGLRALLDLTIHSKENHVSLVSIAERQQISLNYLEQVFAALRKGGVVKSIKGSQGGYTLSDKPNKILISSIIQILEGDFNIIDEVLYTNGEPDLVQQTIQQMVWDRINENIKELLENITLEDLANEFVTKQDHGQEMYYI